MALTLPNPIYLDLDRGIPSSSSELSRAKCDPEHAIPQGFPDYVTSKMAWSGRELTDEGAYVYHLTDAEKEEIDSALTFFNGIFSLFLQHRSMLTIALAWVLMATKSPTMISHFPPFDMF